MTAATGDRVHVGHYISGAGHAGLIGWLLLGNVFAAEPLPFDAQSVSVVSAQEYEAILAALTPPGQSEDVTQPQAPEVTPDVPQVTTQPDAAVDQALPEPQETPQPEDPPQAVEQVTPPDPEVADTAPETLDPPSEAAVDAPELAPVAVPRPSERVAPEAVAQPDPEARPDTDTQEAVAPDTSGETAQDPAEATAPEEATTEIVTEADAAPKAAPNQSLRPPSRRPQPPQRQVAEVPTETAPDTVNDTTDADAAAIAAAVAAAQVEAETPAAPSGPPLSFGEKENMRLAVSGCWSVDVGGRSAQTTVTVAFALNRSGMVQGDVRLLSSEGGDDAAVRTAFQKARSAIFRCQRDGYDLPPEKYEHWQNVEITFNPEKMQVR